MTIRAHHFEQIASYLYPGIRWEADTLPGTRQYELRGYYQECAAAYVTSDRELFDAEDPLKVIEGISHRVADFLRGLSLDGFASPEEYTQFKDWLARGGDIDFEEEDE